MRLVVSRKKSVLREFITQKKSITIGRLPECDLHLRDGAISRHHAVITAEDNGRWIFEDLDSANKSYINGNAVTKVEIHDGDAIRIADFDIICYLEEPKHSDKSVKADDTLRLEAALTTPKHETVVRKLDARHAPAMRLAAKRLIDFAQATEALSEADSLDKVIVTLIDTVLKQFSAFNVWCALREQPTGPMIYNAGKRRDGRNIDITDLQLQDKIKESIKRKVSMVLPSVSAQMEQKDRIRSALIAPIMRKKGCYGIIYVDNAMVHEHYALSDLDYLIFIATHTAAILKQFIT